MLDLEGLPSPGAFKIGSGCTVDLRPQTSPQPEGNRLYYKSVTSLIPTEGMDPFNYYY